MPRGTAAWSGAGSGTAGWLPSMTRPPPDAAAAEPAPSPAEPLRLQILTAPALHRMATTGQLRQMLRPDNSRQLISRVLNRLRCTGLVGLTPLPESGRSRTHAWYLTPEGARLTRDLPLLRGVRRTPSPRPPPRH